MRGLPSFLSLFRNEFNEFNNTRARMKGESLVASHMKWFGNDDIAAEVELKSSAKDTALKSKDTVLRPSVKHN